MNDRPKPPVFTSACVYLMLLFIGGRERSFTNIYEIKKILKPRGNLISGSVVCIRGLGEINLNERSFSLNTK